MHSDSRHSHQVWRKEINGIEHILWTSVSAKGGQYIAVFNAGDTDSEISVSLADLELYDGIEGFEIWSGEKVNARTELKLSLKSHGAKAFYIK